MIERKGEDPVVRLEDSEKEKLVILTDVGQRRCVTDVPPEIGRKPFESFGRRTPEIHFGSLKRHGVDVPGARQVEQGKKESQLKLPFSVVSDDSRDDVFAVGLLAFCAFPAGDRPAAPSVLGSTGRHPVRKVDISN